MRVRPAGLLLLALGLPSAARAQADRLRVPLAPDAGTAEFSYRDVEQFLEAVRALEDRPDTVEVLRRLYFDRGTAGLRIFVEKYDLTPERLARAMARNPEAYARLPATLQALRDQERRFREAYAALQRLIPDAAFPPTWFLVGAHRGIGSGSVDGTLITIEKETGASVAGDLAGTLVHEMVHMQQLRVLGPRYFTIFNEERTLLALSIREGAAEFYATLVTAGDVHKAEALRWTIAHEAELWARFRRDMLSREPGDWLWETPADPAQPQDVGYAVGARIVQAYFERTPDRAAAARAILGVTDYPAFLDASGYADRFAR